MKQKYWQKSLHAQSDIIAPTWQGKDNCSLLVAAMILSCPARFYPSIIVCHGDDIV